MCVTSRRIIVIKVCYDDWLPPATRLAKRYECEVANPTIRRIVSVCVSCRRCLRLMRRQLWPRYVQKMSDDWVPKKPCCKDNRKKENKAAIGRRKPKGYRKLNTGRAGSCRWNIEKIKARFGLLCPHQKKYFDNISDSGLVGNTEPHSWREIFVFYRNVKQCDIGIVSTLVFDGVVDGHWIYMHALVVLRYISGRACARESAMLCGGGGRTVCKQFKV